MQLSQGEQKAALQKWIGARSFDPSEKVEAVTAIYNECGIQQLTEQEMDKHYNNAIHHLNSVSVPEDKKSVLRGMAEMLMVREA